MRAARIWTNQRGSTLLEQVVALALGGIVLVSVASVWHQSQQAYLEGAEAADVQQDLRITLERLTRAIQSAGANPTNQVYAGGLSNDPAFVAFRGAGPQCLRLYADLDGDGRVTGSEENVAFAVATGTLASLTQQEGGGPDAGQSWVALPAPGQVLVGALVANPGGVPVFQFFTGPNDANPNAPLPAGNGAGCDMPEATRARIARVVLTLTAQGDVGGRTFTRTLVSEARARNVP